MWYDGGSRVDFGGKKVRRSVSRKGEFGREIDFLYEMGALRHVERTWRQFGGLPMANDAEHTFRVAWLAWMIGEREGADTARVVKMALLHDMTETRTGDVNHISRMYTQRDEKAAVIDAVDGVRLQGEVLELWREYEWRESLEARVVKDADGLDVELEVMESIDRGETLGKKIFEMRARLREKYFTETARRMFDEIRRSSSVRWAYETKNRFTAGDWQK